MNYSLNTVKKMDNVICNYLPSNNSNNSIKLKKIFDKIKNKIEDGDIIEEDLLLTIVDDFKKCVSEHNSIINDRYNEEYYNDKNIYLNNIKKWDIVREEFNNDSIIFFY